MQRTVIVVGLARSGTSIVAGLLHHLGCDMNPYDNISKMLPRGGFEDQKLQTLCHMTASKGLNPKRAKLLQEHVNARNMADLWGFKNAAMARIIPDIVGYFRNPFIVWVWRDLLHGTRSSMAMFKYLKNDHPPGFFEILKSRAEKQLHMARSASKLSSIGHLHVSFADITSNPGGVAVKLVKVVGGDPAEALKLVYVKSHKSWDENEPA